MSNIEDDKLFFQYLGEVWSRILIIENLMRWSLMVEAGEEMYFPNKTPYVNGDEYDFFPKSFTLGFEELVTEFNKKFLSTTVPLWLISVRHALAHGMIAQINESEEQQLIKFKIKGNKLFIEHIQELNNTYLLSVSKDLEKVRKELTANVKLIQVAKW